MISKYKYVCLTSEAVDYLLSNMSDFFRNIDKRAFDAIFRVDASVTLLYTKEADNRKLNIQKDEMNIFWGWTSNTNQIKIQKLRRGVLITHFCPRVFSCDMNNAPQSLIDLPDE